jgi:hypothetical protein
MFKWLYDTVFGAEKVKDAPAPAPVPAAGDVKAAHAPTTRSSVAKPPTPTPTAKRPRPADGSYAPAPTKVAKTASGRRAIHMDGDWRETFKKVYNYFKRVGNFDDIGDEEPVLAEWLKRQQRNSHLTAFQKSELKSIGAMEAKIEFKPRASRAQVHGHRTNQKAKGRPPTFEVMYERVLAFKKVYGHTLVPSNYEDAHLAQWIRRQRLLYSQQERGLQDKITEERIEKLNSIGFAWKLKQGRPRNNLDGGGSK